MLHPQRPVFCVSCGFDSLHWCTSLKLIVDVQAVYDSEHCSEKEGALKSREKRTMLYSGIKRKEERGLSV